MCQNHTLRVEITLVCDVHTHTMMNTRTRVISERKVWFQHARVWFIYVECELYTQSVIATRRVWFLHAECNFQTQCDFDTHKCDDETYNCDCNTHNSDYYTQSVILTHKIVIMTLTKVIMTLIRVKITLWWTHVRNFWTQSAIYIRRVWFPHVECDFHTQRVISTRRVLFPNAVWFWYAQMWLRHTQNTEAPQRTFHSSGGP
jgi:hypothetical protein